MKSPIRDEWRSRDGRVRLILGDCRAVLPTLDDRSVDFVFTDPPYGHNNNNGDLIARWEAALGRGQPGKARPIANDGAADAGELAEFNFSESKRLLRHGCCCCCCCGGGGPDPQFARWSLLMDRHLAFKQMVIWDKGPMGMGWHYRRSYETVLVGQRRGGACRWYDRSCRVENVIRPGGAIRKIIPRANQHPTEKPTALAAHFIGLHSRPGHLVLDPFMGGGSTGVACVEAGRQFVGVELSRRWFDYSVRRIKAALAAAAVRKSA